MDMNRKHLLLALSTAGYAGNGDLADIKQFLNAQGRPSDTIEINGTVCNIDELYAKTVPVKVNVELEDEPVLVAPKKKDASGYKATVGKVEGKAYEIGAPAIRSDRQKAVNEYDRRLKAVSLDTDVKSRPVFGSGDEAEFNGAWFRLATAGNNSYSEKSTDRDIVGKAGVEWDNTLGGALVPQQLGNSLIWLTEQYGVITKLANVQRLSASLIRYPRQTSIGAMTPSGEAASKTATDDTQDTISLDPKEAALIKQCSYQLYEDAAVNVGDVYARNFAEAASRRLDLDAIVGDGTSTYNGHVGLLNKLTGGKKIAASGAAWSSWTTGDFNKVLGRLEYVDTSRIAMLGSRQNFYQVPNRLAVATSQFAPLVGPGRGGSDRSFLDLPYYFAQALWESQSAPDTTSGTAHVFIGDFKAGMTVGIRDDIRIKMSDEYGFASGTLAWRGTMRYAVNVHLDGRGATYGPLLALANS